MRKADAVLASIDSQHSWQQTHAVVEMAEELQAACLAGQSWLDSQAEQQIAAAAADAAAAAEGEAGAHGGYLHAHERDAAELQAALAAMAEQQEGGGWTSMGARGGTASKPAAAAEEEDMEESHGVRRWWGCGIGDTLAGQRLARGWPGGERRVSNQACRDGCRFQVCVPSLALLPTQPLQIAGQNAYAALLDDNEGWEDVVSGKNKKNRSRGGHNQRRGGKGRRS
jgi:hypothetical protein